MILQEKQYLPATIDDQVDITDLSSQNATPVKQAINIQSVVPDEEIYVSNGLGAATSPKPYIAPIKPINFVPNLDIEPVFKPKDGSNKVMPEYDEPTQGSDIAPQIYITPEPVVSEELPYVSPNTILADEPIITPNTVTPNTEIPTLYITPNTTVTPEEVTPEEVIPEEEEPEEEEPEEPKKKIGILDSLTNYIYKLIYK